MSRNGAGTYSLPSGNPVVTGTTISSADFNNTMSDLATALTGSLSADGQTPWTGDQNANGNRVTGLAAGSATSDAVNVGQVKGPAFSAYQNVAQSTANNAFTLIQLQAEEFDTASAFDSTTNYRFQPLTAGYYLICGAASIAGAVGNHYIASIFKNGAEYKRGNDSAVDPAGSTGVGVTALVQFNGSTDYVDLRVFQGSGSPQNTISGSATTYLAGYLARLV